MHTILLVEDDKLFRWAIKEALEHAGYRVLEAATCREARVHIASGVGLALIDQRLADGTGLSLLDEITTGGGGYPVVILTPHKTDEGEAEARCLGASGYLAKPDDPFEIVGAVEAELRDA